MKTLKPPLPTPPAAPRLVFSLPAIESLYTEAEGFWPEQVKNDSEIREQVFIRQYLSEYLDYLYQFVKQWDNSFFLNHNIPDSHWLKIAQAYDLLSDYIGLESYNQRLLLYLPFELIPDYHWESQSPELNEAITRFRRLYQQRWRRLLQDHDYRANFIDGDVLEPEIRCGKLPMVVKAAHLIPFLLPKGLVSVEKVFSLIENSSDAILNNSLMDALSVLNDLKMLSPANLSYMLYSDHQSLRNLAIIIQDDNRVKEKSGANTDTTDKIKNLPAIIQALKEEIKLSENYRSHPDASVARLNWEKSSIREKIIDKHAEMILPLIISNPLLAEYLQRLTINSNNQISTLLGVSSFNKVLVKLATADLNEAHLLLHSLQPQLLYLWRAGNQNYTKPLEKLWLHCEHLGVIKPDFLKKMSIKKPGFDCMFDVHQKQLTSEMPILSEVINTINDSPEISRWLYPVFIVYGSTVKGYGATNADLDIAVFIKPNIEPSERPLIKSHLQKLFAGDGRISRILEFWLIKDGFGLWIKDLPDYDRSLGNSTFAHVFFNGVYFGTKENINFFYEKLMITFLRFPSKDLVSQDVRTIWLQEIERDLLQYRLMHKGYAHARPEVSSFRSEHSSDIDSNSSFWDAGYRQVASKLFIKKVFLPQL